MIFTFGGPWRFVAAMVLNAALVGWAVHEIFGQGGVGGAIGGLAAVAVGERRIRPLLPRWSDRRAAAAAVRTGQDRRPELRSTVTAVARQTLADHAGPIRWLPLAIAAGLGGVLVVVGLLRGDGSAVLAGSAQLAWGGVFELAHRRAVVRAGRWLAAREPAPEVSGG